jgi:signal peptidase I
MMAGSHLLRRPVRVRGVWRYASPLLISAVLAMAVQRFGLEPIRATPVPRGETGSMGDTIRPGEVVLLDKFSYRFSPPQRGDVIVSRTPFDLTYAVMKRLIGLPGERVEVKGCRAVINGEPLDEPYV